MSTTSKQPPVIPPRPARGQDKDAMPKIPPRPLNRRIDRSLSPNPDRFAPSPLNESPFPSKNSNARHLAARQYGDPVDRPQSLEMPSVGDEGREYELLAEAANTPREQSFSPEQTHTVAEDLKLHAPKPSLPAQSEKQRVMTVTRTDSDKAASFGIGRPGSEEHHDDLSSSQTLKKKASTTSQVSSPENHVEEEQGIPEIGQQVPMYRDAGDVQAPSSGPTPGIPERPRSKKASAIGLPPGSYGLHGHGVAPQDTLEKAYYEKHPHLLKREVTPHHHDRPNDYSMSSEDLNKIIHDRANRGHEFASNEHVGTPSEQVGWQAIEESTSHVASASPQRDTKSSSKQSSQPDDAVSDADNDTKHQQSENRDVIHVDEPARNTGVLGDEGTVNNETSEDRAYDTPILAEDEVRKHPSPYVQQPAIEPTPGASEPEEGTSSRPSSRPSSLYKVPSKEHQPAPLEDVEEYEPLFPDEGNADATKPTAETDVKRPKAHKHRFPSRDIWEDAPDSAYHTAHVSTPDVSEQPAKAATIASPPPRDTETPAQAFARHQEELAEKELGQHGGDSLSPAKSTQQKPTWAHHQTHLMLEKTRPSPVQRFPSRDVWEDAPDSLRLETTVSTPQRDLEADSPAEYKPEDEKKPEAPERPQKEKSIDASAVPERPLMPQRPKPKKLPSNGDTASPPSGTSSASKPPIIPDRPKPQIPARPLKAGPTSGGLEPGEAAAPPKKKPAIPTRPAGSKFAALQANFMNDLNKKLGLGPQVPKKEEPAPEEVIPSEQKEKIPLSDARKGRARGPQRRAPTKSQNSLAVTKDEQTGKLTLTLSLPATLYEIDPEADEVNMGGTAPLSASTPDTTKPSQENLKEGGAEKQEEDFKGKSPEQNDGSQAPSPEKTAEVSASSPGQAREAGEAQAPAPEQKHEKQTFSSQERETEDEIASPEQVTEEQAASPPEQKEETESSSQESVPSSEGKAVETKTLATNMAGESVVEEDVKINEPQDDVEPTAVEEH